MPPDDLELFLRAIWRPGDVREVRAPKYGRNGTLSGYFDDPIALADAVRGHDGRVNLYVTANPVNPALLARSANRLQMRATATTSDADVRRRNWLVVDIDPVRPAGISATDDEREAAHALADAVGRDLSASGWPEPIVAMSGNGYLLLYAVDLPNDPASARLVEGVLRSLAAGHSNGRAKVDTAVGNASRIVALVGTVKVKGDSTPERPHRRSALMSVPAVTASVSRAQLEALAPARPQERAEDSAGDRMPGGWVLGLLDANHIAHGKPKGSDSEGIVRIPLDTCPFHPEISDAPCGVGEAPDGRAVAKCFHDRGAGKGWQEFKSALGLRTGPVLNLAVAGADGSVTAGALSESDGEMKVDGPTAGDDSWEQLAGDALHGGRFAASVRGKVVYDATAKAWYVWAGHHWRRDGRQAVKRLYRTYLAQRMAQSIRIADEDKRRAAMASIMAASRTDSRINGALAMASVDLSVESSIWDRDPWLLGVKNGVVDLRTGALRDGRPDDYITKSTRASYAAGAPASRWRQFLHEVFLGDTDLIDWLQLLLGYACIGIVEAEIWALFHGGGSNGKSTLLKAARNVLGSYATTANPDSILTAQRNRGSGPDEELAALRGTRLVTASEAEHDIVLSSAKAKKLAAKDTLRASRKFEHDVTWEPTHLLVVAVNQLPQLNDSSHGAWRRIVLVPFLATFGEDNLLESALQAESDGILAWLVEGAVRYARLRTLDPKPAVVMKATADYRESEDHVARFINECATTSIGERVKASIAYKVYAEWCYGVAKLPHGARWSGNVFGRDFARKASEVLGSAVTKAADRNGSFWYHDIKLTPPAVGITLNLDGATSHTAEGEAGASDEDDESEGATSQSGLPDDALPAVRDPAGASTQTSLTRGVIANVWEETPSDSRAASPDQACGHPWPDARRLWRDGRPTTTIECRNCGARAEDMDDATAFVGA